MKKRTKKIIVTTVIIIAAATAILAAAAAAVWNFYVVPKYNAAISSQTEEELLTGKDMITFAKYLTDDRILDNIKNFNKKDAVELLNTMLELAEESESEDGTGAPETEIDNVNTGADKNEAEATSERIKKASEAAGDAQKSAYDRIMAEAKSNEISDGAAIIAKIDLAKTNALSEAGDKAALRKYVKSVLTQSEIKRAVELYNKYKHLL